MPKIVVRLLPPELTEEGYRGLVGEAILKKSISSSFYPGLELDKNSTGYLSFDKLKDAETAIVELNGKQVGKTTYKVVACMAPFQKVSTKPDQPWTSPIEEDSQYIQFLETMKLKAPLPPAAAEMKAKDFKTPLVEYLESMSRRTVRKKFQK